MDTTPKLLQFDRRTIATMNAINRVLDRLSTTSISGAGISAFSNHLSSQKMDWLIPVAAFIVGASSQAIRELLTYLVSIAKIENPLTN
ncbi:hypothetical protein [Spirosoma agri]|uniref:Uncharacterized protein n=1 Tax=Spirosoma agri TaxID=1987381 RepID=A0A6M0IMZ3_9BACT|nr:hypothetical protein [Spirosoma agri]NEU68293.1 hypothetical protein [Spirosoma agri]